MSLYRWDDVLDRRKPMAHARIVRREKYAWPGGYELALVMDDGALLCAACVASEYSRICYSARHNLRDGWHPEGIASADWSEQAESCAHCNREIFGKS